MISGIVWNLFEYGLCLIELFFLYMFLNEVIVKKEHIPEYMVYVILIMSSIVSFALTRISIFSAFKVIVGYGICIIVTAILYKAKFKIKLFWGTIYYIGLGLIDVVSVILISYITKIDIVTVALSSNWYRILLSVFAKLIAFILIKLIAKTTRKSLGDIPAKFWHMILGVFAIALVSIIAVIEIGIILQGNELAGLFLVIISIGILVLSITVYQTFQYMCNYFEKEKQYEIIEYQNEMLIKATLEKDESHKEIRKIWHDFNNHISCIDMLLQMDNIKRARQYIYDMKINSEKVHFDIKTGNEIADAVINQKYMLAKKHDIQFNVNGFLGENMSVNAIDLCALMSNGLDNAIEANLKVRDKHSRKIHVHMKPYKDYLLIEIINAVGEELKNIEHLQTTKKDKSKHGFGMLSMKKIAEKYDGYLQYSYENKCFSLSIMLKVVNE
ncbi:ATP-binding protein [Cellulosilyticum sp. I15G10I2]|uniref:ATP-binding protein n=1 Tax=Cellulosilyticum sp. I15G10I2 TaxID=1892843 RepID=UPI00085BC8F5|nr:ATP-binding protein [Cellulosilyticum sp. I15G10I2]